MHLLHLTMLLLGFVLLSISLFPAVEMQERVSISFPITAEPVRSDPGTCTSSESRANVTAMIADGVATSLVCGGWGWTKVVDLDMGDPSQQCPPRWFEVADPERSCSFTLSSGCEDLFVPITDIAYRYVCGRIIGYAGDNPRGFFGEDINFSYLDGISLTRGFPFEHVWSMAVGLGPTGGTNRCPCDNQEARSSPGFVGENYFCDGSSNGALWDGEDCTTSCCTFNSPPWFSVALPTSKADELQVFICAHNGATRGTRVRLVQLFVR